MKTHYNDALNPTSFKIPLCRQTTGRSIRCSTDIAKVTCRRCLQMLDRVKQAGGSYE